MIDLKRTSVILAIGNVFFIAFGVEHDHTHHIFQGLDRNPGGTAQKVRPTSG
jgi:hypothetical protein